MRPRSWRSGSPPSSTVALFALRAAMGLPGAGDGWPSSAGESQRVDAACPSGDDWDGRGRAACRLPSSTMEPCASQGTRQLVSHASICAEKQRLLGLYEAHTKAFSMTVTALHQMMGTSSKERYGALRRAVEDARAESECCRLSLERHISKHGC